MIWLFDVNTLIAIADSSHVFHEAIHRWLAVCAERTWATCPITENGMVRVLSQPAYRGGARTPTEAIVSLRAMTEARQWKHTFWADDFSICDARLILAERIAGAKQLTDVYLAALARKKGGRLVTFDTAVAWQAIRGGTADLIEVPPI